MDNRYSTRPTLRSLGRGAGPVDPEASDDDPLVEMARMVSGQPAPAARPRRRSTLAGEPGMSEADLARALEAELLSDLQATLAAVRPEPARAPRPQPIPQAYAPESATDDEPAYQEDPYYGDVLAAGQHDYVQPPEPEAVQDEPEPVYYLPDPEPEPEPAPPPASARPTPAFRPRALPRAVTERAFESLNLRRGNVPLGPAYNPGALAERGNVAAQPVTPPPPSPQPVALPVAETTPNWSVHPPAAEDIHPFDEVARQHWENEPPPHIEPEFTYPEPEYQPEPPYIAEVYDGQDPAREVVRSRDPVHDYGIVDEDLGLVQPPRKRRGRMAFTVVAFLVFVGLAAAAMIFLRGGGDFSGTPPLIMADTNPTRIVPENPTAAEPDVPGAVVFDRVNPQEANNNETLLPATEPPAVVEPPADPADAITRLLLPDGAGAGIQPIAPPAEADGPRAVRTVTVMPDGTIMTNQLVGENGQVVAPPTEGADAPIPQPLAPTAGTATPIAAVPTAPVVPAPAAPAAATTAGANQPIAAGIYVQVSSQTTEQAALNDISAIRAQAPSLVGGVNAVVQTAVVTGIQRYRAQFGPIASEAAANTLCASLRGEGIDCIIARNN